MQSTLTGLLPGRRHSRPTATHYRLPQEPAHAAASISSVAQLAAWMRTSSSRLCRARSSSSRRTAVTSTVTSVRSSVRVARPVTRYDAADTSVLSALTRNYSMSRSVMASAMDWPSSSRVATLVQLIALANNYP